MTPEIPARLTDPLPPPARQGATHRGVLELLAEYESLRRRANADRAAIVEIMSHDVGSED
ncbi:hypothetical protein [Billgrantia bachuensis]|uniref:hypothetical protein n=1 Tax=Billgrantia bachuensis TaxID=2717286 RepID=UPI0014220D1F|nr:hypothetical protein [Halomonas bachuensis]